MLATVINGIRLTELLATRFSNSKSLKQSPEIFSRTRL
jgi:hypothetical protein